MMGDSLIRALCPLTPATTWGQAVVAAAAAFLAVVYVLSLIAVYTRSRACLGCQRRSLLITGLAAISWPAGAILAHVAQPAPVPESAPRRRRLRLWLVGGAALLVVAVAVGTGSAIGGLFLVTLACLSVVALAMASSAAVPALLVSGMNTVVGVAAWGVVVAGMLVLVVWHERRARSRALQNEQGG